MAGCQTIIETTIKGKESQIFFYRKTFHDCLYDEHELTLFNTSKCLFRKAKTQANHWWADHTYTQGKGTFNFISNSVLRISFT